MILFKFEREDRNNCRTYYRGVDETGGKRGHLYCIQNEGGYFPFKFYSCSRDGEPSHGLRMPLETSFDKKVLPS